MGRSRQKDGAEADDKLSLAFIQGSSQVSRPSLLVDWVGMAQECASYEHHVPVASLVSLGPLRSVLRRMLSSQPQSFHCTLFRSSVPFLETEGEDP